MSDIVIANIIETDDGWEFEVSVDRPTYRVTLSQDYYRQLTEGETTPEDLVAESFRFLLEREPASSILKEFDLSEINGYFPEYEEEMKKRLV